MKTATTCPTCQTPSPVEWDSDGRCITCARNNILGIDPEIQRIVDTYGKSFEPSLLPHDLTRGQVGRCFDECIIRALYSKGKYQYVEGIATNPDNGEPVLHAWLTDESGKAYDPTWLCFDDNGREHPLPVKYKGVILDTESVAWFMKRTGYQGVLWNRSRDRQQFNKIIRIVKSGNLKIIKEV